MAKTWTIFIVKAVFLNLFNWSSRWYLASSSFLHPIVYFPKMWKLMYWVVVRVRAECACRGLSFVTAVKVLCTKWKRWAEISSSLNIQKTTREDKLLALCLNPRNKRWDTSFPDKCPNVKNKESCTWDIRMVEFCIDLQKSSCWEWKD